jgi:hypothetical protein
MFTVVQTSVLFLICTLSYFLILLCSIYTTGFFWFKQVLDRGPEQRESKLTVLCLLIIIKLISYITIYYIIIKLLIMENHPS